MLTPKDSGDGIRGGGISSIATYGNNIHIVLQYKFMEEKFLLGETLLTGSAAGAFFAFQPNKANHYITANFINK